jgi:predicted nucleic acid-binding protein
MKRGFVDTNILIYAADSTGQDPRKTQIARELILQPALSLSVQVLNEFVVTARNPKKLNLTRKREAGWIREWLNFQVMPLAIPTFEKALEIHLIYGFSHWDSLILAAALESGCDILYSEDLQTGQLIGNLQIINPFL